MRTRPFAMTLATILCVMLVAGALGLAGRSYFRQDGIAYIRATPGREVITGVTVFNGVANFIRVDGTPPISPRRPGWHVESTPNQMPTWQMGGVGGFWSNEYDATHGGTVTAHVSQRNVPLWFVALLAAILPTWQWIAYRRSRRRDRVGFDVAPAIARDTTVQ